MADPTIQEQGPWTQFQTQEPVQPQVAPEETGPWAQFQTPVSNQQSDEIPTPNPNAVAMGEAAGAITGLSKGAWDINKYRANDWKPVVDESPYGVQKYLNKQLKVGTDGIKIPRGTISLEDLSKATGMDVRMMDEVQAALKKAKGIPGERVPIEEIIQGVPTIVGYKTVGGTSPIDLKPYLKVSELEKKAPALNDFLVKNYKPIESIKKRVGAPVALGVSAAEAQAAFNRAKEGDTGRAALDVAGAIGAPVAATKFLPKKLRVLGGLAATAAPLVEATAPEKKAKGGLVHLAGGGFPKLVEQGAGALQRLARAPKRSNSELKAIAERMAPQVLGQHVPEATGKSLKQFQREQELQHLITPNFERSELKIIDPQEQIGKVKIGIPGDISRAHETIHEIAGKPLNQAVESEGGPLYGLKGEFWAGGKGAAQGVQNIVDKTSHLYDDADVIGSTMKMPMGMGYAQHYANALMNNIDYSKVKNLEEFNDLIRKGSAKGQFPDFAGIENPEIALAQMQKNPKLRTHFTGIMEKPTITSQYGLPEGRDVLHAISEPNFINLETGASGVLGQMRPGAKLTPSSSSTYSHDIPGQLIGVPKYPVPYELEYPDAIYQIRQNPIPMFNKKTGEQTGNVGEFGRLKMGQPRQFMDPQYADEISQYNEYMKSLTGMKKGGLAGGGVPDVSRLAMNFKDVTKRIPQLTEAANKLKSGASDMTRELYEALVNTQKPVTPYSFVPKPATAEEAIAALDKNKALRWQSDVPAGHPVGLRLDIPAYRDHGVWVNSIHNQGDKAAMPNTSYSNVSHVKNASFTMPQEDMLEVAAGASKTPKARINGEWHPTTEEEAVANAQQYLNHPEWTQVGMDPERHGYFYDRTTMEPITHAEEALQIGPLVLAKKPVYGKKEDFKYKKGGKA